MRRNDPRIRQTINQISQNLESANLTTQASLFNFSQNYVSPCLSSIQACLEASCQPCFRSREDQQRRPHRGATRRGRDNLGFDFYDDWDEDEGEWGNDELSRLLAGNEAPGRHMGMTYGSAGVTRTKARGKDLGMDDPNIVPSSSMFGFLERLPWKIGGRGKRYRPSAADLKENVGKARDEGEPLINESDEDGTGGRHGRKRSGTAASNDTTNSLSSRGDLFPSEDEDDAVPLDDEFSMALERRNTGATSDDRSSRKRRGKKPAGSRTSLKTASSKDTKSPGRERPAVSISSGNGKETDLAETADEDIPSMIDLKREEERVREAEDAQVEMNRQAAQRLAVQRGLSGGHEPSNVSAATFRPGQRFANSMQPLEENAPSNNTHPIANSSSSTRPRGPSDDAERLENTANRPPSAQNTPETRPSDDSALG